MKTQKTNEGNYCIITGEKKLDHLTFKQLKSLYAQIQRFTKLSEDSDHPEKEQPILLQKYTTLYGNERHPQISYCLYSKECDIQMISYPEIKKLSNMLQFFLDNCPSFPFLPLTLPEDSSDAISIYKDSSASHFEKAFRSPVNMNQRITYSTEDLQFHTEYMVAANEQCSNWLSPVLLNCLYRKLGEFLKQVT